MKLSQSVKASSVLQDDRKTVFMEVLRRRVLNRRLPPGTALDELALVQEFGLSRPPIREVFRTLAAEGYIVLEAHQAPRVTHVSHIAMRDFFQAAPLVYDATLQLAALHSTPEDISTLRQIQNRYRSVLDGEIDELLYVAHELYVALGSLSSNAFLLPSVRRLLIDHVRFEKAWHQCLTRAQALRVHGMICLLHDQIVDAVEARSQMRVSHLVRRGMRAARRWAHSAIVTSNMPPTESARIVPPPA